MVRSAVVRPDTTLAFVRGLKTAIKQINERKKTRKKTTNQRTNGPVIAHLIYWPSKAQNIQNLENIW